MDLAILIFFSSGLFLGFSLGVDPWEVVDFVAGFVLLDPRGDDF